MLKDERAAILSIVSYYDRQYSSLKEKKQVYLLRILINLSLEYRFGISLPAEENILSKFLQGLEAGKHNLWGLLIFAIVENNTYPANHKLMEPITQIIVREAINLLDVKGNIKDSLTVKQFFNIMVNYAQKYLINRLTEAQKAKFL